MYKQTFKYLFLFIGTGLIFATGLSGCREYGNPCPSGKQDHPLKDYEKSFMIYQGTETLVFIDLNHNRDTIRFKGTGIETGIDTSFITTNENINHPCIDTTFFEYQKVRFINEENSHDELTFKISKIVLNNDITSCISVKGQWEMYHLLYLSTKTDSLTIDGITYHNLYSLSNNIYHAEKLIFFNKEYGIINYNEGDRNLVLKSVKL